MPKIHIRILAILLSIAFTAHSVSENVKYGLTDVEFNTFFNSNDKNGDNIADKSESKQIIIDSIGKIFQRYGFWKDEPMIEALAEEISNELAIENDKQSLKDIVDTLPSRSKSFRAKIFNDLIEKFELGSMMNDPSVLSSLDEYPATFGLTYENWKFHMIEMDEFMIETQKTLEMLKELTKDVEVDPEEYERVYKYIMNEAYNDPDNQAIYDEFNFIHQQTQELKGMIGEKNLEAMAQREKAQELFDL